MTRPDPIALPIDALLPDIRASLAQHPRLVIEAPPGAGKTTQVPLALLDAPWLAGRRIIVLEPRRVAARAAAAFMARQLGEAVGERVGYRIRFDSRIGPRTRIEVVTEGILTRMLQDDPTLGEGTPSAVGALIFDEFHERHMAGDLGLALALEVQASMLPAPTAGGEGTVPGSALRIVLMSATLDGERLAQLVDAPRLSSAGRSFAVTIAHVPLLRADEAPLHQARRTVLHALATHPGDVLVFLPGQREIAQLAAALQVALPGDGNGDGNDVQVLTLHGELPVDRQAQVLQPDPQGRRRVVLATNVAESSVTLPGVRAVVDSGLAREPRHDPNSGFSRLDVVSIAQSSADQRAGRAGRVADGWAYRLWPQSQRLEPQRRPEIVQVELAGLALELAAWGSSTLRFVDAPPPGSLAAAQDLLERLGALTPVSASAGSADAASAGAMRIPTPRGRAMLALGTHPRLAAMLLSAHGTRERALACDLAALIEARDPLRGGPGMPRSDAIADRWHALAAFRAGRGDARADRGALAAIDAASQQWQRRLPREAARSPRAANPPVDHDVPAHLLGNLLAHAFPDRVAHRHVTDTRRYQLANGRSARLFDDSMLVGEPWIVVAELRGEARDALVLRAAPLDEQRLRADVPQSFVTRDEVQWDATRRALVGLRVQRFDGIVLDARPAGRVDPAHAAQALVDAVGTLGIDALPWSPALRQWQARVSLARGWAPALALPDVGDAALLATRDTWLLPAFAGHTRLDALGEDAFALALHALLDWPQRQALDRLAPPRITVPSGQARAIDYVAAGDDGSPVLAVKLQELFGLADTPRVGDGRVPLTVHLLSPAGRPLQVTQDLRGFWDRTWPEVRAEMKGRYPRHPWPIDPWTAPASHRAKPRG